MSRVYIKDENGDVRTNSDGEALFYSTDDGDSNPDTEQTVYAKENSIWGDINGDCSKTDSTFNPSTGRFINDRYGTEQIRPESHGCESSYLSTEKPDTEAEDYGRCVRCIVPGQ